MLPQWAQEPTLDDPRLTARQRAKLEKEAGIAEVVQWHEMELPPELQYTWKGKGELHQTVLKVTHDDATRDYWIRLCTVAVAIHPACYAYICACSILMVP